MPRTQRVARLHLPALKIKGFRGVKSLFIPKLGRVTLLAGKNSVGKTSVLEAVAIFAARGRRSALSDVLEERNELLTMIDEDGDEYSAPNVTAIFHGRDASENPSIVIGPSTKKDQLTIKRTSLSAIPEEQWLDIIKDLGPEHDDDDLALIKVVFRGKEYMFPWADFKNRFWRRRMRNLITESEPPAEIPCKTLGPGLLPNHEIAQLWDEIALTKDEEQAVDALRLIFRHKMDRIAVIGNQEHSYRSRGRRVIVKLKDHPQPVPLKSLGDGAIRLFSVALALANSRDGILLIDEAENGIHHSVQSDFWRMVLRMARENNTQVLATTHSWDCVRGFAQAAADDENNEGILIRLERDDEDIQAVFYSEDELQIAAEQGIDVR